MSRLKLNLDKALSANKVPSDHAITLAPTSGLGTVVLGAKGVFHDDLVVKDPDGVVLVKGTDWDFGHVSRHAKANYGIDAYGSIVLKKTGLSQIRLEPNYLGGSYGEYSTDNIPQQVTLVGGVVQDVLYWDSERDAPYKDKADEGLVLPGGSLKTSLEDVSDILEMFARIPVAVLDDNHVISLLNQMLPLYQNEYDNTLLTDAKSVRGAINEVRNLLLNVNPTGPFVEGYTFGGIIYSATDLDAIPDTGNVYYLVWPSNPTYTLTFTNDAGNRVAVNYSAAIVVWRETGQPRWNRSSERAEEGLLINRVDARLESTTKTVEEAVKELVAKDAEYDNPSWEFRGYVTEAGAYPVAGGGGGPEWWAVAVNDVQVTGDWSDGDSSKALQAGDVVKHDPADGKLVRGKLYHMAHAAYPTLNPALGTIQDVEYHIQQIQGMLGGTDLPGTAIFQAVPGFRNDGKSFALTEGEVLYADDNPLVDHLQPVYGGVASVKALLPQPPRYEKTVGFEEVEAYANIEVDAMAYDSRTALIYFIGRETATTQRKVYQYNRTTGVTLEVADWMNISNGPKQATVDEANDRLVWGSPDNNVYQMSIADFSVSTLRAKVGVEVCTIDGGRDVLYSLSAAGVLERMTVSDGTVSPIDTGVTYGNILLDDDGILYYFKDNKLKWFNPDTLTIKESDSVGFEGGFTMAINPINRGIMKATQTEPNAIYYVNGDKATITPYVGGELDFETLVYDERHGDWIGYKPGGLNKVSFVKTMAFYMRGF